MKFACREVSSYSTIELNWQEALTINSIVAIYKIRLLCHSLIIEYNTYMQDSRRAPKFTISSSTELASVGHENGLLRGGGGGFLFMDLEWERSRNSHWPDLLVSFLRPCWCR